MKKEKYVLTEVKHKSDFWKNFIAMTIFMLIAEVFVYGVGIVLIYQRGFGKRTPRGEGGEGSGESD